MKMGLPNVSPLLEGTSTLTEASKAFVSAMVVENRASTVRARSPETAGSIQKVANPDVIVRGGVVKSITGVLSVVAEGMRRPERSTLKVVRSGQGSSGVKASAPRASQRQTPSTAGESETPVTREETRPKSLLHFEAASLPYLALQGVMSGESFTTSGERLCSGNETSALSQAGGTVAERAAAASRDARVRMEKVNVGTVRMWSPPKMVRHVILPL